ncbi:MAG: SDR family NAD(P)-dependent oxidoreductase [Pseudomonadales bacterium]
MTSYKDKVAVITGGASGIGFAIAQRCMREGMKTVICDIEQGALDNAEAELKLISQGRVYAVKVDVSKAKQMQALADRVHRDMGSAYLLFNNAGVGGGGCLWEQDLEDWEWVLGINLMGVVHGIKAFAANMVANNAGHIINTASVAGLMSAPNTSTYTVSKHAVVGLSEVLYGDLRNGGHDVGVSVLCPSFVNSKIYNSDRNRPEGSISEDKQAELSAAADLAGEFFAAAMAPADVADLVFQGIEQKRFYILTHQGIKAQVEKRMQAIMNDGHPSVNGPEDYPFE